MKTEPTQPEPTPQHAGGEMSDCNLLLGDSGNPWIDHAASFRRADMLRKCQDQLNREIFPDFEDQKLLLALAVEAHDAMSIIGGGELIGFGKLPQAIVEITGTESDKAQMSALKRVPYPIGTADELAECLIQHGLIDCNAWHDAEGYDGGIERDRIYKMQAACMKVTCST